MWEKQAEMFVDKCQASKGDTRASLDEANVFVEQAHKLLRSLDTQKVCFFKRVFLCHVFNLIFCWIPCEI